MTEPQQQPLEFTTGLTFTQKISMVAGSVSALYLLPSAVNAAIVYNPGSLSISVNSPSGLNNGVQWDVDGDGNAEFTLWNDVTTFLAILRLANTANVQLVQSNPPYSTQNAKNLPLSFNVGPTLAAGYQFGGAGQSGRTVIVFASGSGSAIGGYYGRKGVKGFSDGVDGYLGFSFQIGGNTHYGWARLNPVLNGGNSNYTIVDWAYNDTPNAPIHIADTATTPEPTSTLALLAFGAAGVYRWRKGKTNPAQEDEDQAA